jgi:carboxymethylenebutenolidase
MDKRHPPKPNVMIPQAFIQLYDKYTHASVSRGIFFRQLLTLAGSVTAARAILPMLENKFEQATTVREEDLFTETISFAGRTPEVEAYIARPKAAGLYPTVLVIHENRGLNPHIKDVTRRAAAAGFLAIAPNALSALGGTPENEDEARALFQKLDKDTTLADFIAAVDYAAQRPDSKGNMGCVGFCWGGAMASKLAIAAPSLKAAVSFYGMAPDLANVPNIQAAIQLHYASLDERVNATREAYINALQQANKNVEAFMYEGVNHAFHNNTAPARYNEAAASLAWERTILFWKKYL